MKTYFYIIQVIHKFIINYLIKENLPEPLSMNDLQDILRHALFI